MKKRKIGRANIRFIATMMIMILTMNTFGLKAQGKEMTSSEIAELDVSTANKEVGYSSGVQPLTTMVDCEIVLAFTGNGLEMTFTTLSVEVSSVIGVKDIKVQQKMWYGWKTVFASKGAENYNEDMFATEVTYPDAVDGKTYRVTCTHYANYDVYEEAENDTGAFKFVY